jgi:hypothetical protein
MIEFIGWDNREHFNPAARMGRAQGCTAHGVQAFAAVVKDYKKFAHDIASNLFFSILTERAAAGNALSLGWAMCLQGVSQQRNWTRHIKNYGGLDAPEAGYCEHLGNDHMDMLEMTSFLTKTACASVTAICLCAAPSVLAAQDQVPLQGQQCFLKYSDQYDAAVILNVAADGRVVGETTQSIHDEANAYFTFATLEFTGTLNYQFLEVDIVIYIEGDVQNEQGEWLMTEDAISVGNDIYLSEDCAVAQEFVDSLYAN